MASIMKDVPFSVRVNANLREFHKESDGFYYDNAHTLKVEVELECFDGTSAVKQINTVTNLSDSDVVLSYFSSAAIKTQRGKIAVDRNRWQCEGQWSFYTPEECGLTPATIHPWEREVFSISSTGSWATGVYYPLTAVLGDDGHTYYMELEGSHSWQLTHSVSGGVNSPLFELEGSGCSEENGGWFYVLKPRESYQTQPAVFGKVLGGFEEMCADIIAYKRAVSLAQNPKKEIPVVFNTYMNCIWASPSQEKLFPLIEAAGKVGCEYFCIDDGWFTALGDWDILDERFGEGGLACAFEFMKENSLIPGVWFEFDRVGKNAKAKGFGDECFLTRYGHLIDYDFFNFENEKVREHLFNCVERVYKMGVRYIKNDYNKSVGIGCDNGDLSHAEGLIRNYKAFVLFIDRLREKFPDLIIENCGSGACRSDNGILRHFHLQSTSDQEVYYRYPSIILGGAAQYPLEKSGNWSYPMPFLFDEMNMSEDKIPDWQKRFCDGEETVFNMINGMCGVLYQSGRLDLADDYNLSLVKNGIELYKKMRGDIFSSSPLLPFGTCYINECVNTAFGLQSEDKSHAYLAVWRIGTESDEIEVDIKKYGYIKASVWYPDFTECEVCDGKLKVKLPKKYSARMVLLEK